MKQPVSTRLASHKLNAIALGIVLLSCAYAWRIHNFAYLGVTGALVVMAAWFSVRQAIGRAQADPVEIDLFTLYVEHQVGQLASQHYSFDVDSRDQVSLAVRDLHRVAHEAHGDLSVAIRIVHQRSGTETHVGTANGWGDYL